MRNLLLILGAIFLAGGISAQTNRVKDPFFEKPYSTLQTSENDKWIHILNPEVGDGEIRRVKQYGFADSILYCKSKYKAVSSNRSNCAIIQRVTGLKNKKYKVCFWLNMASRYAFFTSEISYYNESLASETGTRAGQLVLQTNSATSANYLIPDNWTLCTYDIDLSGVTDLRRLESVRLSFYPNCSNATTQTRECHYFISEPKIYEIGDLLKENISDNGFERWDISSWPVSEYNWDVYQSDDACIKRAPGHRDADFCYSVTTLSDQDNSFIETNGSTVTVPASEVKLSFYARAENPGGEIRVGMKNLPGDKWQTVKLSGEWKRYEVFFNYDTEIASFPSNDALQFRFLKANRYFVDECWLEPASEDGTGIPIVNNNADFAVYQHASEIVVDGMPGYLQIYDASGMKIYTRFKETAGKLSVFVNVPGIYLITLTDKNIKMKVQKILVR